MDPRPAAIQVSEADKTFQIPHQHVMSIKERALHPLRKTDSHELHALDGVSLEVLEGEFFGIVGRNGSGKSTLLKCLAGIYGIDSGEIVVAGRLVPFIELGVGFNMEMTAYDNVVINGVMMGMTPREARRCFDEVIEFAELEHALDLKLKNYSSGMQVRLAFALMVQAESDVLLIDEVLAVGDAAFQQKCFDAFRALHEQGKTIVLVTHDMQMVERFCDRAMLLERGKVDSVGDSGTVARRYLELNFAGTGEDQPASPDDVSREASIGSVWLEGATGQAEHTVAQGESLTVRAIVEANEPIADPEFGITVHNEDGVIVFGTTTRLDGTELPDMAAGDRVELNLPLRADLRPARYFVDCGVHTGPQQPAAFRWRAAGFLVYGSTAQSGLVQAGHTIAVRQLASSDSQTASEVTR